MKYRYVLKNKHTGKLHFKTYSLESIEKDGLKGLFDIENYEIISRDRFTESKDKNNVDIYENDIVLVLYNYLGNITVSYSCGTFNISKYFTPKTTVTGNIHEKTTV